MTHDLHHYIESEILPRYDHFDPAHRRGHADTVISESLRLGKMYGLDEDMLYTIAAYHDTGLCEGRERHHIVSKEILLADERLRQWFSEGQLLVMGDACEDHRASSHHEPRTIYGKVLAEADRNIDPETILIRTIQFGFSNYPELGKEEQYARFCEHLNEKYASGGYFKLLIPESGNAAALKELRKIIDDKDALRKFFESHFKRLSEEK